MEKKATDSSIRVCPVMMVTASIDRSSFPANSNGLDSDSRVRSGGSIGFRQASILFRLCLSSSWHFYRSFTSPEVIDDLLLLAWHPVESCHDLTTIAWWNSSRIRFPRYQSHGEVVKTKCATSPCICVSRRSTKALCNFGGNKEVMVTA